MEKLKRRQRAYKIADKPYEKAKKMAAKYNTTVANIVEKAITEFSEGNPRVWLVDSGEYYSKLK